MPFLRLVFAIAFLGLPLYLSACADVPQSPEAQAQNARQSDSYEAAALDDNDPFEPVNRAIFEVNDVMDWLLIKPLAEVYRFLLPDFVRDRVANILANMGEPVVFANNLLQGEVSSAGVTLSRLVVNSTVGVGGMFEVANDWGLEKQAGDFGQTLSVWGVGSGPYLVLPLFGPSNVRDAIGLGVDTVASPWPYIIALDGSEARDTYLITSFAVSGLSRREQALDSYDALRAGSLDFYAEMRSVYRQYRNKQLGLKPVDTTPMFNFEDED
ncbi:MAG: VacJ family lipoprotein [Alphaproteobacteria bacterium]|nr:VacJ family lipoprotein [Alphaproteobacteria bacterium]